MLIAYFINTDMEIAEQFCYITHHDKAVELTLASDEETKDIILRTEFPELSSLSTLLFRCNETGRITNYDGLLPGCHYDLIEQIPTVGSSYLHSLQH